MIKAVVFDYDWVLCRYYFLPQRQMFALADSLRAQGIKTALLSNRFFPLTWLARLSGQLKDFDPVIFARQAGAAKPQSAGYLLVIKKLGLKPSECLFVDNRADNIAAAQALGMPVVLAHRTAQAIEEIQALLSTT